MTSIPSRSSLSNLTLQTTTSIMYRQPQLLGHSPRVVSSRQQIRHFRFGLWAGILQPQRERRRQLKQKCVDAMLPRKPRNYQHLMQDYLEWKSVRFDTTTALPGRRWVSIDVLRNERSHPSTKSDTVNSNAGGADQTLDRSSRPFWGKRWGSTAARWRAEVYGSHNGMEKQNKVPTEEQAKRKSDTEQYEYDPVSNRMVPKKIPDLNELAQHTLEKVPPSSPKPYRSRFAPSDSPSIKRAAAAIHLDGPPTKTESALNEPSKSNDFHGELRASNTQPLIDPEFPPKKNELDAYKPFKYNEPDGKSSEELATAAKVPSQGELENYTAFRYNEPDGHGPEEQDAVFESLKEYESRATKSPSKLLVDDSETSFIGMANSSLREENMSMWEYARRKIQSQLVNGNKMAVLDADFPDDAHKYKTPYKYNEPDEHPPKDSGASTLKNQSSDFPEDAHKYQTPYKYNEPDGHPPQNAESSALSNWGFDFPEDTHKYRSPYKYNEPDGHYPAKIDTVEESLKEYDSNPRASGMELPINDSETSYIGKRDNFFRTPDEERLGDFLYILEEKGHDLDAIEEQTNHLQDLRFSDYPEALKELNEMYKDSGFYAPNGEWIHSSTKSQSTVDESKNMNAKDNQSLRDLPNDAYKYNSAYRYNEPDGKAPEKEDSVEKALKEFDNRNSEFRLPHVGRVEPSLNRSPSRITAFDTANKDKAEDLDLLRASDVRAASGIAKSKNQLKETGIEKESRRKALEANFNATVLSGLEMKKPTMKKYANRKKTKLLTGNFVRDFPEEFSTTWRNAGSTLAPTDMHVKETENKIQQEENEYAAGLANQDAYTRSGSNSSRIQTSLDRGRVNAAAKIGDANANELQKLQAEIDPYSKEPQGLETSYAREIVEQGESDSGLFVSSYGCGNESSKPAKEKSETISKDKDIKLVKDVREIYEEVYGTISTSHRQGGSPSTQVDQAIPTPGSPKSSPNLYKILAFEPSTQSVEVAETTSIIPDTSDPLTPAEALMRLSNPAKFFPHFERLRNEGYEIVSGSGDVLVFRKVRDADSFKFPTNRNPRNPVDGMSPVKPATGNFASPTGFVNHDLPSSSSPAENSASPRFKSNIDVRREEPVFSGRRNWEDENEYEGWKDGTRTGESGKRRMSRGKRVVVGAGMMGGACYAAGVVAEWFRTGGVDGAGTGGRF